MSDDSAVFVTDANGRVLQIVEMDPADQLDLFEACAEHSTNPSWTGMALLACSVRQIDGIPVMMPKRPSQVKDLARKLGREGIKVVAEHLRPKADSDEGADKAVDLAKN